MSWQRFKDAVRDGHHNPDESARLYKKDSEAPDYKPVAEASEEAARIMAELGYAQLDFAKEQYEEVKPFVTDIAETQVEQMRETNRQGSEYYDFLAQTFRPVESSIAADAMSFDTEAKADQLAADAGANIERQAAIGDQVLARDLARMGVNPNSGKYVGSKRSAELMTAAQKADAQNDARTQADMMGRAVKLDAAGIGRGLPGASVAAYGAATAAGNSASNNIQTPGAAYQNAMAAGASTIGAGQSMKVQGLSNVLSAETSYLNNQNNSSGWGDIITGAAGIGRLAANI
jgi:hypothetical protein